MTKRWLVWVGAAVCLALAVGSGAWLVSRPYPVSRAGADKIQVGMTRAEVEAILGGPPGDYSTRTVFMAEGAPKVFSFLGEAWSGNEGCLWVRFDGNSRVAAVCFEEGFPEPEPTLFDRLRAWLGW